MSGRTVLLKSYGDANTAQFELTETPIPTPGKGEVVVRMTMAPVNPADIFSIMGVYPGFTPASLPAIPGLEGCGVVHAVGEDVSDLSIGQRVVPFIIYGSDYCQKGNGSWQSYKTVRAVDCFKIPDSVNDESASQFVVNPFTAWLMINELAVPKGEYLIQTAAGSVLGRQVISICRALGIKTINVVRRKEQAEELKAIGADEVLTFDEDVPARVRDITAGRLAWGALDAVGGNATGQVAGSIRNSGTVLIYGAMSGLSFSASIIDPLFRDVRIRGFWVTPTVARLGIEKAQELASQLWPMFENGTIEPFSGQKFDLANVAEAVKASVATARGGKVLLTL